MSQELAAPDLLTLRVVLMVVKVSFDGTDGGWLGANGQFFSNAEDAWQSLYGSSDQLYPKPISRAPGDIPAEVPGGISGPLSIVSPEIIQVTAYLNRKLWRELKAHPERILGLPPRGLEEFVAELFFREGYDVELTPPTRDGGRDIIAVARRGITSAKCLVECKQSHHAVGIEVIRQLYGVVEHEEATHGIVATSSVFTRDAREFLGQHKWRLGLKDYDDLKQWLRRLP